MPAHRWAIRRVNVKMCDMPNEILPTDTPLTHARLEAALHGTELGIDASELDGLLTGYVCGGGKAGRESLSTALQLDSDDPQLNELLAGMHDTCVRHLGQMDMNLEPLLPADGNSLHERADALVDWTRGFLGGFGLAGTAADALSGDGREVLRDLGVIAASRLTLDEADENADEDESALMELLEFVRVGAMLLQTEVAMAETPAGGRTH